MEMKKFMTQGEDSVSYDGSNETGAFSEVEFDDDEDLANSTDTAGMYKAVGVPQIGFEGDSFTVYSNNIEDLEQAQQGLSHYGIKYGEIRHKKTGHWHHYMSVYIPSNYKGEFLTLREWLTKTGRKVEDVMRPDFVKGFNKITAKVDKTEDVELINSIFDSYVQKSNEDSTIPVDSLLDMMFAEMEGLPFDRDALEAKFRAIVDVPTYYDIFDKYLELAEESPEKVDKIYTMLLRELKKNKIKVNPQEVHDEFYGELE
jgi:hypothetical protein